MKKIFFNIVSELKELDVISKASLVYVFVGFFQKAISVISGPIFTRILSQEDYGMFCTYNSWYELIGVLATLSLCSGVYNNGLLENENDRDQYTFSMLILSNIASGTVALIGIILWDKIHFLINLPPKLLLIMMISYIFSPAFTFWNTRQRFEYKYIIPCAVTILSTILAVGNSIIITWNSKDSCKLINKIYSEKIILLIFWIGAYLYISYKAKFKIKMEYWKYSLKFNLPLIPHYLSNYVLSSADRLMIANLINTSSAAIYSVAYSVAFLVQIFWQSVNGAILPLTYESIKANQESEIQKRVIPFLGLYGMMCVLIAFAAPEIMLIFAPYSYLQGIYIIPILSMGVFMTGLYCLFANVEFYYKATRMIAFNSIFSASLNIVLNYVFIKWFGFIAAAYTTVVCYFVQTLLHYINYRRVSSKIYNEKIMLSICIIVFAGCISCIPLYTFKLIRYIILISFLWMCIQNRKRLLEKL